ncbi:Ferric_reduct domain-containing protein/FAD_binding_8 domain-containing protein/NAD_binding_6 domain-containing protein [Cephalotus follicularis]|uniref:Ferric_reduct domain-containing protein/FAD_binding_8 domain-containing protein/NAD_binding_6 domain-containing protein n=1 Tax=Cephalotus follicularis TaxID=3775 RepID=A0A1Q3B9Y7_CEPFO|nr:Ferric_reduct domain-containing protein/FAD_binding_8 domain-containing protein/NAD_binding_6 domain-containing protein [Cephalotus follicularis]
MARAPLLVVLKLWMIFVFAGWITLWLLKPTNLWTTKWKAAENKAMSTVFGYYGLNFVVYSFPIIVLAISGLIYMTLQPRQPRSRQVRSCTTTFSNPLVVNSLVGTLSVIEMLVASLFILFLVWTFYARISNDFKKLMPVKSLKLNVWQLKYVRVATRFGLLAEPCLALLFLPILRGLAVFRVLGIQFEVSVRYHVWLGSALIFFATLHGALFIWGLSHHISDEKTGRRYLTGEITLVTGLVMGMTSIPQIRRKMFEMFYYTHHLYIVFIVFFLFHAGDRHFYSVFPGIFLFGLDKFLRIIQSRPETCILSARVFPCKVIELSLPKDPSLKYAPTSVVFMKIPSISKYQWHPFSISSNSSIDDRTMSMIIKCEGEWTSSLYQMIQTELKSNAGPMSCIPIAIEGPYGPAAVDFLRYDSLLLVAGGIGITPFLSILQDIGSAQSSGRYRFPTRIQLIYVVKSSQDVCVLNSISFVILKQSSEKWRLIIKVFVTKEEKSSVTVEELLNDLSKVQTVQFSTECEKYAVHGLESSPWMTAFAGLASVVFLALLICFNRVFVTAEKKGDPSMKLVATSEKKAPKEKTPWWVADLIIVASFVIAITCSTLVAIILRRRKLKNEIPLVSQRQGGLMEASSIETRGAVEEHEIHFGGRPNFEDIFSKFPTETGGSDIGVLVCGPETMKESVASLCQLKSQGIKVGAAKKRPYFSFHSLNFTL